MFPICESHIRSRSQNLVQKVWSSGKLIIMHSLITPPYIKCVEKKKKAQHERFCQGQLSGSQTHPHHHILTFQLVKNLTHKWQTEHHTLKFILTHEALKIWLATGVQEMETPANQATNHHNKMQELASKPSQRQNRVVHLQWPQASRPEPPATPCAQSPEVDQTAAGISCWTGCACTCNSHKWTAYL